MRQQIPNPTKTLEIYRNSTNLYTLGQVTSKELSDLVVVANESHDLYPPREAVTSEDNNTLARPHTISEYNEVHE